jgi:hypothetical protein
MLLFLLLFMLNLVNSMVRELEKGENCLTTKSPKLSFNFYSRLTKDFNLTKVMEKK